MLMEVVSETDRISRMISPKTLLNDWAYRSRRCKDGTGMEFEKQIELQLTDGMILTIERNPVEFLPQFCNARGMIANRCMEEFGSGRNDNRKKWNPLLEEVMEHKRKTIVISNKDRLIRFS